MNLPAGARNSVSEQIGLQKSARESASHDPLTT
jgi:hypothetical protein